MEFMGGSRGQQYPVELRERAVRMVAEPGSTAVDNVRTLTRLV